MIFLRLIDADYEVRIDVNYKVRLRDLTDRKELI